MNERYHDEITELMAGGYDMHVHSLPSHFPRIADDFEIARDAGRCAMRGVLIKSHYEPTGARAGMANKYAGSSARLFGGIALNWPCGGLNPYAVESAVRTGAKMIWMPTRDAAHSLLFGDMPGDFYQREGLTVLDEDGGLRPAVYEILEIAKAHGIPVATGHLSVGESCLLCVEAIGMGVKAVLTHPDWHRTTVPPETQVNLAKKGVYIEKICANVSADDITAEGMAVSMKAVGYEHVFIGTDRGQCDLPMPSEELYGFIGSMLEQGIAPAGLRVMLTETPEALLGL